MKKEDPLLVAFVEKEKEEVPFIDAGPPLNADGTLEWSSSRSSALKSLLRAILP